MMDSLLEPCIIRPLTITVFQQDRDGFVQIVGGNENIKVGDASPRRIVPTLNHDGCALQKYAVDTLGIHKNRCLNGGISKLFISINVLRLNHLSKRKEI